MLHMVMCMIRCYPLKWAHPFLPRLCPQIFSLCLCLQGFLADRHSNLHGSKDYEGKESLGKTTVSAGRGQSELEVRKSWGSQCNLSSEWGKRVEGESIWMYSGRFPEKAQLVQRHDVGRQLACSRIYYRISVTTTVWGMEGVIVYELWEVRESQLILSTLAHHLLWRQQWIMSKNDSQF